MISERLPAAAPKNVGTIDRICNLPPFRPVVAQVMRLSSEDEDDIDFDRIAAVVESDAALAAEMLRVANSPLFGLRSRVYGIRHSITILGLERTKALAFRIAIEEYLDTTLSHAAVRRCWLHTLACAEIAKDLADKCGLVKDEAYTAGLMHDVGRLALIRGYPREYVPLLETQFESQEQALTAEADAFGCDHCEAGHALGGIWGFPKTLSEIAWKHHSATARPDTSMLHIVRLACSMADVIRFDAVRCKKVRGYREIQESFPPELRSRYVVGLGALEEKIMNRILSIEK